MSESKQFTSMEFMGPISLSPWEVVPRPAGPFQLLYWLPVLCIALSVCPLPLAKQITIVCQYQAA